jgi:ERCC4-type nuclease
MDDFVDWLETNHRQNVISKVKSPATMTTNKPVIENDSRIKALMGCGVNRDQAVRLLDHYGTIPILLQKKTRQGDMMEVAGINRKQAKAILSLRDEFSTD